MNFDPQLIGNIGNGLVLLLLIIGSTYGTFRAVRPQNPQQRLTRISDAQAAAPSPAFDSQTLRIMGSQSTGMQLLIEHLTQVSERLDEMNKREDAWQIERQTLTVENQRLKQENAQLTARLTPVPSP